MNRAGESRIQLSPRRLSSDRIRTGLSSIMAPRGWYSDTGVAGLVYVYGPSVAGFTIMASAGCVQPIPAGPVSRIRAAQGLYRDRPSAAGLRVKSPTRHRVFLPCGGCKLASVTAPIRAALQALHGIRRALGCRALTRAYARAMLKARPSRCLVRVREKYF